ncbi:MAG: cyclohexyl-isocyanide hydratase [Thermoanaerobaculia bacterium]|jgi:cyclohexyl-isocyanide hydratase|nr:cyclohexyl-isocyanide hydratase [Thermoanaerobaculia bacterium]
MDSDINIIIPLYNDFNILDVTGPIEIFHWVDGLKPYTVAENSDPVRSTEGVRLIPDVTFDQCPRVDVLWVPGGNGPHLPLLDERYMDFVRKQGASATWVTSVCVGGLILGAAGLLDGYKATTHWSFLSCLALFPNLTLVPPDPHKKDQEYPRWVIDRNRVTGGGVSSGLDEALVLVSLLKGDLAAKQTQLTTQYAPLPPFRDGDPQEAEPAIYANAVASGREMIAETSALIEKSLHKGGNGNGKRAHEPVHR